MKRQVVTGFLVLCLTPLFGAHLAAQRSEDVPPLDSLVSWYVRHDVKQPLYLVGVCPVRNPYGDRLMLRLMAVEQTPQLVIRLATSWRTALGSCGDARIGAWYRARLAEAREWTVVMPLVSALLLDRTPANIAAMRSVAFDESRSDELRSNVLFYLEQILTPEQKIQLFVDVYRQPGRMPEPYALIEGGNLIRGPHGERFVDQVLQAVLADPNQPDASALLVNMADDVHTGVARDRPGVRERVLNALDRAAANRDGRLPRELVELARSRAAVLRGRP